MAMDAQEALECAAWHECALASPAKHVSAKSNLLMLWNLGNAVGVLVAPPAILFFLMALGLWHARTRWGLKVAWTALLILWLLSTPIVANTLYDRLLTRGAVPVNPAEMPKTNAAIVVLPAGKVPAGEYPDGETAAPLTVQRARYAVTLAKATGLPLVIPGGKHRGVLSEAELTRRFVEIELGQPVALIEERSLDTRQSALNLVEPLRARKIQTVVLVTDARHMPRASQAFAEAGFNVIRAPMAIRAGESKLTAVSFLPSALALLASYDVSHELVGRAWYAVRALATRLH
jgi:uncharacterized SAM-binding protein YcdF (DUF218 family)